MEAWVDIANMKVKVIFLATLLLIYNGCSSKNLRLDSDNDGVADIYDKCKNTPFLELVDSRGCPITNLAHQAHIVYKETKK